MSLTTEEVHRVAVLARLELTSEEETKIAGQLGKVLDYFELLAKLDVDNVEPTAHIVAVEDALRDDVVSNPPADEALWSNAPAFHDRHFRVPKIIE